MNIKYEILYILSPSISEEEREKLIKKFSDYITSKKGTVAQIDKWGIKKLAYPIAFKNEGYYILMNYACEPQVSNDMEKLMLITDGILRTLITRK